MNAEEGFDHAFLAGAYKRIQAAIVVLTLACALGAGLRFGIKPALGVGLGGAISFLNFLWLKQSMLGLSGRFANVADAHKTPKTTGLMLRFFLRYAIIAMAAYATIASSTVSAYGVMLGLLLSAPALLLEAIYETWYALRHDS